MFYEVDFRNYGSTTRSCVVRMKRNKKSGKKNKVDFVARQLSVERAVYFRELWKRLQMCSSRKYPDPHHGGNFT